jgi:hypothetical protein
MSLAEPVDAAGKITAFVAQDRRGDDPGRRGDGI